MEDRRTLGLACDSATVGVFDDVNNARRAIDELSLEGIRRKDIRFIEYDWENNWDKVQRHDISDKGHRRMPDLFSRLFAKGDDLPPELSHGLDRESEELGPDMEGSRGLDPETERYIKEAYQQHRHLVIVDSIDERERAIAIMQACGAEILGLETLTGSPH